MRVPRTRVSAPARAARGVATAREGDAGRGRSVRARSCAGRAKWCPARPPRPFRGIPTSAPKVRRFRREFGGGEFQIRSRSDGRFRGAREGSGTSSFSRPRARDSWLGNAAPLGAFGDASRAWILSPANQLLSARAARGHDRAEADVGESARRGGVSRAMSAARAASGASASASARWRGRVGATGAGRRGRRRCRSPRRAVATALGASSAAGGCSRIARSRRGGPGSGARRGSPRPRRARPRPGRRRASPRPARHPARS